MGALPLGLPMITSTVSLVLHCLQVMRTPIFSLQSPACLGRQGKAVVMYLDQLPGHGPLRLSQAILSAHGE
ncbi:hypothetical protein GGS26DRAFT_576120 [Hypomontagnella submonticulosa]|nr:hypothetical protein GGS26DRAFT_576120 [Hypomontagnella submonticulosa]